MKIAKYAALGVGACLVVVIVGASAVLKAVVDAIDGRDADESEWPFR